MRVDLEKELLKANKVLITNKELLYVQEFEKSAGTLENDALNRVGIDTLSKGERIKNHVKEQEDRTKEFDQSRVFHISQIEEICNKYYLKFLPARYYKGSVDKNLAGKICSFEAAYNKKCTNYNTRIIAPAQSFELEERPKDPLFFYAISDEYYYLIYKWGNDLNISRRFLALLSNPWFTWFCICFVAPGLISIIHPPVTVALGIIISLVVNVFSLIYLSIEEKGIRFIPKNNCTDHYRD